MFPPDEQKAFVNTGAIAPLKFEHTVEELRYATIDQNNILRMVDEMGNTATVQLQNEQEVADAIAQLKDDSGDSMYDEGTVFDKYPELHWFRP